ncbi:ferritin-like domain-containing protein [Rhodovarius crocodyli]|uniref:Ferritin-like domain-containing protein n=1 Tax=Rhodovarius crocodyli TaxID=1979269 RepID=A0A437MH49_9PROT|nr:ferritin-like domain-containing protein [Rhodovarius crocodyli]RVT96990.1 ferritin-like domain-containing protein [Rhodovarius crocodyli]
MKHWHLDDVAWDRFDPSLVEPDIVPLVKAAAMVERNGDDYAEYLKNVFRDDPDFRDASDHWALEEVQHGDALGRWASLADPTFDYPTAFARYRAGYKIDVKAGASIRGSRSGELVARCIVETGTSSYYTALADATKEPVLQQVCRLIAADEYRHFKLFYDHLKRYLEREKLSHWQRLRVAAGRATESEDDELAFAFHCSNEPEGTPYDHTRCITGYMARAMKFYQFSHLDRGMGMMFKAVGFSPRGRASRLAARAAYRLVKWRQGKYERALESYKAAA